MKRDFTISLQPLSVHSKSPSCSLCLHSSTSGMHKWEAPSQSQKRQQKGSGLSGNLLKSNFTSGDSWAFEEGLATSWSRKMHLLIPLQTLYSHYWLSARSGCPMFFLLVLSGKDIWYHLYSVITMAGHQQGKDLTKWTQDQDTCTKIACRNHMLSTSE